MSEKKVETKEDRNVGKSVVMLVLMALSVAYLVNPGAGFLEFIPDNIPGIGNLDEAGATALLIACLAYFGFDVTRIFARKRQQEEAKEATVTKVTDASVE
ncbi:MAG: hypothetical protein AAGD22_04150 [Verrucomicrobiota bacterium]